ncbi:ABC transporter substrate-binding protein [Corynebacterium hadale]|uniref:ABC transporter substrate-binding protein n=1 Tax=Corynebacterium hadale TaxID=2026255 RepID=UPI003B8496EA
MDMRMTAKTTLTALFAMGSVAALLVGCSEPSAEDSTENGSTAAADGGETTITVYTSEPEEKVDEINQAFEKANPDVNVEVYRAGTGDLTARLEAEKTAGSIEADIFWAADAPTFETYKEAGDLAELKDVDTSKVIEEAQDADNMYVGTRIIPTVIAYNTGVYDQGNAPASWQALTDPEYQGKIVMPDPSVSGAAAYNATVWKGNEELGDEWITKLGANQPMIAKSNGPTSQEIAGGGHPVGVVVDYLVRDLADAGSPIATSYPEEGAPFITEPIAVFKDSDAQDAAQRYINFVLSEEGQKLAVEQNYLPVIDSVGTPGDAPSLKDIPLMEADLKSVTNDREEAVSFFQNAVK